jgi:hypothetical protein
MIEVVLRGHRFLERVLDVGPGRRIIAGEPQSEDGRLHTRGGAGEIAAIRIFAARE